jgi:hypothetical protein
MEKADNESIDFNNQLIKEFMGGEHPIVTGANFTLTEYLSHGLYHKSWDWLMPVVEKIDSLPETDFEMYPAYESITERSGVAVRIWTSPGEILVMPQGRSRIEVVYKSVIEFIKWYNSCPTKK